MAGGDCRSCSEWATKSSDVKRGQNPKAEAEAEAEAKNNYEKVPK